MLKPTKLYIVKQMDHHQSYNSKPHKIKATNLSSNRSHLACPRINYTTGIKLPQAPMHNTCTRSCYTWIPTLCIQQRHHRDKSRSTDSHLGTNPRKIYSTENNKLTSKITNAINLLQIFKLQISLKN